MRIGIPCFLLVALSLTSCCGGGRDYYVSSTKWRGGEIRNFYEYADSKKLSIIPSIVKQELVTWKDSFCFPDVRIRNAFLVDREVYLIIDNNFGRYFTRLLNDGNLEYLVEVNELRYSSIFKVELFRSDDDGSLSFTFLCLDEVPGDVIKTVVPSSYVSAKPYLL